MNLTDPVTIPLCAFLAYSGFLGFLSAGFSSLLRHLDHCSRLRGKIRGAEGAVLQQEQEYSGQPRRPGAKHSQGNTESAGHQPAQGLHPAVQSAVQVEQSGESVSLDAGRRVSFPLLVSLRLEFGPQRNPAAAVIPQQDKEHR